MQHIVCSIYDTKAKAYLQPFFTQNAGTGIRAFSDACNDSNSQFFAHPEDYILFHLAYFDDASGSFESLDTPVTLGAATEYVSL